MSQIIRVTKQVDEAHGKGPRKQVCGLYKQGAEMPERFVIPLWDGDEPIVPGDYQTSDAFYVGGNYKDSLMMNSRDFIIALPKITK